MRSATVDVLHGSVHPYVGDVAGMAASVDLGGFNGLLLGSVSLTSPTTPRARS